MVRLPQSTRLDAVDLLPNLQLLRLLLRPLILSKTASMYPQRQMISRTHLEQVEEWHQTRLLR